MFEVDLNDPAAERAVLAGICSYGASAYYDVAEFLGVDTFTIDSNQMIYKCLTQYIDI